jgi:lipopolysaccharide export system permease protein
VKHLNKYIIKSFIPPFIATFLVTWFVFIMQFFWLYIDDMVGKGLDTSIILKLIAFLAPTLVPMALPLGLLLAGIMTLGNHAENSELTAVKCSGISLVRFTKPLIVFVCFVTCGMFLFNNYVIPACNLKFWTLLMDIRNTKPAVNIKAGVFYNAIPGYSIYINDKDKNNTTINDVMIYDHTSGMGNDKIVLAKKGEMYMSADKRFLIFELTEGCRFEEKKSKQPNEEEQVRLQFKFWKKIFDLSAFEMKKTDDSYLKGNEQMLRMQQIDNRLDSLNKIILNTSVNHLAQFKNYISLLQLDSTNNFLKAPIGEVKIDSKRITDLLPDSTIMNSLNSAKSNINLLTSVQVNFDNDITIHTNNQRNLQIEWHRKITNALSCLVLFLLGAPLGALIKKGGFGTPFVIAVVFFVLYYFMIVFSEKLCKRGGASIFEGMYLPLIIIGAIAALLFNLANKDKKPNLLPIIDFVTALTTKVKNAFAKKFKVN